jgi:hypothetical protein
MAILDKSSFTLSFFFLSQHDIIGCHSHYSLALSFRSFILLHYIKGYLITSDPFARYVYFLGKFFFSLKQI